MKLFLAHRIDIYNQADSFYVGLFEDGEYRKLSIEEIRDYQHEIITYNLNHLLDHLRMVYEGNLPIITDLGQIIKINTGRSKKTYSKKKYPWIFWNRIHRDLGEEESNRLYSIIREGTEEKQLVETLKALATKVKKFYEVSFINLKELKQESRFNNLENAIQQVLNERQVEGIHVDVEKLDGLITELETNKNALVNRLRYKYGIINLDYKYLRRFLIKKGFKLSNKDFDHFNLISFLKNEKISSELCKDIYITIRVKSDYEKLKQYIIEEGNLIFPVFDCIGTITSRILINYPHIQQLKRENRTIFRAKEGYALLYCDYNQFEPGILASNCKDEAMLDLYNSSDIYTSFSEYIFGTKALRKEAKVLFLSYLYGMSNKKLVSSINRVITSKGLTQNTSATEFFSKFEKLEMFKLSEYEKAVNQGYIQSETTLRRNIKKTKDGKKGKKSETRFVLSQLIQGQASFILKSAILEVSQDSEIEFLVPMHDAVLYQVPKSKIEEKKEHIETVFLKNFLALCPDINAKVDFKAFEE